VLHSSRPLARTALAILGLGLHCSPADAARPPSPTRSIPAVVPGRFAPGPLDAITDVPGVRVGHVTLVEGDDVRTGVTAIVPHDGNLFQHKVPAAIAVANGFGKLVGHTQVAELGQLETPILLTNTLQVWDAAAALVEHTLEQEGNADVRSVNPVVGETNDGWLSEIRKRPLQREHFLEALRVAKPGPVEQGSVGAGTGTRALGYKGGIGTASRSVEGFSVGVLVQANFGGSLVIGGVPVGRRLAQPAGSDHDGSCMIVVATDAPLDARQLGRLARRTFVGMARTGASFSHGSGDYAIAFSTAPELRIPHTASSPTRQRPILEEERLSPMFEAVADATEEAIVNALMHATTVRGRDGHVAEALPLDRVRPLLTD
jgi:D-aminopeptidase